MKKSYETPAIVRQALFIRNASNVLAGIDEEVHDTLNDLLEEEIDGLEGWTCDGDNFGPDEWYNAEEEDWRVSFELTSQSSFLEEHWLLAAARHLDLGLALALTIADDLPRHRQLQLEVEAALESHGEDLPGVEKRYGDERRLVIPLAGLSLEELAESASDWENVLKAPLQDAVAKAVRLREALRDLIDPRIS